MTVLGTGSPTRRVPAGPDPDLDRGLGAVVGHERAVEATRRQLERGTLAHAYWLTGPRQVGKTSLALAAAAEFLHAESWPGGLGAHPDLWLEDREGSILVDRIRRSEVDKDPELGPNLEHFLSLTSFSGRGKVAVIGNAERLNQFGANALLRILEEPPPATVLWLCTSRPEAETLPSTLRSRCQELTLGLVQEDLVRDWLTSTKGVEREAGRLAAALSLGLPGLALELASDPRVGERAGEWLGAFLDCAGQGPGGWLELSRRLAERGSEREGVRLALRAWASFLRDCCAQAAGVSQLVRWPERAGEARAWAKALGLAGCARRYDLALDALARVAEAATPRLVLDRFLLLSFGGDPPNPPRLERRAADQRSEQR